MQKPLIKPANPRELFFEFAKIGLSGFGGVLAWARRSLVERLHWLSDREFAELLAIGQMLPGPNIVNLSVLLGWQFFRWRGVLAVIAGLVFMPMLLLIVLAIVYDHIDQFLIVRQAVAGMLPVIVGMVLATTVKLTLSLPRAWRTLFLSLATLVAIGVLRWSLLATMMTLLPLGVVLEWESQRREVAQWWARRSGKHDNDD
ncbi:MAG: chromate transporter [Ottowia sp.]|nr:chromate transporter [Ottowia sp.]